MNRFLSKWFYSLAFIQSIYVVCINIYHEKYDKNRNLNIIFIKWSHIVFSFFCFQWLFFDIFQVNGAFSAFTPDFPHIYVKISYYFSANFFFRPLSYICSKFKLILCIKNPKVVNNHEHKECINHSFPYYSSCSHVIVCVLQFYAIYVSEMLKTHFQVHPSLFPLLNCFSSA